MRLFLAVNFAEATLAPVRALFPSLEHVAPKARWAHFETLHLTLAFLGETPAERLDAVREAMTLAAASHGPLLLGLARGGTFGSPSHPRVLWVDVSGDVEGLLVVQKRLAGELRALDFPLEDRAFRAHLTLARAREPRGDRHLADCVSALAALEAPACTVDAILLYQSHLGPHGARHELLHAERLRGGAAAD